MATLKQLLSDRTSSSSIDFRNNDNASHDGTLWAYAWITDKEGKLLGIATTVQTLEKIAANPKMDNLILTTPEERVNSSNGLKYDLCRLLIDDKIKITFAVSDSNTLLELNQNIDKQINEDFLLLLIENNGLVEISTINIDNYFENETLAIIKLCYGSFDNIPQIIQFIIDSLKPKLPNKVFNYCKKLDIAYQSVIVNIDSSILDINNKRDLIYTNQKNAIEEEREYNLDENILELKSEILKTILLWFKVFNIEFAYEKAKKIPNMLVYSHRISGWSNPEYKITDNLKQQVKTNFGYGSVSYFYSLLTFKNIQITPFSEWIHYRNSKFSEVIRYTRSFKSFFLVNGRNYCTTKIENSYWHNALEFTKKCR
ncbi:hypothetical protein [uncultured Flavobacterium sp.]|uniref:hypothetical protein n=1 Tax=uncultured Flavobacterium sp. TaxID=165435 RepID=UPI002593E93F|nr:hypothetical protein [uncultured Flavobacterium sp.]